jgi:SAM-dependent methyltransferase
MRAQLEQAVPEVETITAYAERMPFEDSSVDAVTSAQAFHWFATEEALDEIARLLRPGGRLGLVWNSRDPEDPIQQVLTGLIEPLRTDEHTHVTKDWREVVEAHARFGPIEEREFDHEQVLTADGLADRILSISFVAVLPPERQAKVAEQARSLAGSGEVRIRYVTTAYITPRLD